MYNILFLHSKVEKLQKTLLSFQSRVLDLVIKGFSVFLEYTVQLWYIRAVLFEFPIKNSGGLGCLRLSDLEEKGL